MKNWISGILLAVLAIFTPVQALEVCNQEDFRQYVEDMALRMESEMQVVLKGKAARIPKLMEKEHNHYIDHAVSYQWRGSRNDRNTYYFTFEVADNSLVLAAFRNPSLHSSLSQEGRLVLKAAKEAISRCTVSGMGRNETILAVAREVYGIARIKYGYYEYKSRSCANLLIDRTATQDSYARTMQLLLSMLDVPSHIIQGKSKVSKGDHMWNIVEFGDGKWYHVDVYADKMSGESRFKYFGLADAEIRRDHSWSKGGYERTPKKGLCIAPRVEVEKQAASDETHVKKEARNEPEPDTEEDTEEEQEDESDDEGENKDYSKLKKTLHDKWKPVREDK